MSKPKMPLPDFLKEGIFVMICSGETFFTEIVKGENMVDRMMTAMFGKPGEDWENWPQDEWEFWAKHVYESDHWADAECSKGYVPCHLSIIIGAVDEIDFYRLDAPILGEKEAEQAFPFWRRKTPKERV